ncbi:MAG: helix-turn-helix domain-containing protein [Solirubrobacteraceae bacterium]
MPRGRPPKEVDPTASAAARLGAEIRARRVARNLTLQNLADLIHYTPQYISEVELGNAVAAEAFVIAADEVLDAGGFLVALYPAVALEQTRTRQHRSHDRRKARQAQARMLAVQAQALRFTQEVDDVKRRAFLGLGIAVVMLGPEAAARATADDWERIAYAWGYEITTVPDRSTLLPGLLADLKRLDANGGPQRTIAQLSSYVAMIQVSSGSAEQARKWWRRAQVAANASGDPVLRAGIMGHHAVEGVFGLHSPNRVLALTDQALALTETPCIGRIRAFSGRVRALALQGRTKETRNALTALEAEFERLPRAITSEKIGVDGWSEAMLHNVTSFAGAFAGIGAEASREAALRLYSSALWRGPTQVKLHRSLAEADARMALEALGPLTDAQRKDRLVRLIALKVLSASEHRNVAGTDELRAVLT